MTTGNTIQWRVADRTTSFRWGYVGDDVVAEWEGLLTLQATADGELKDMRPAPGIDAEHAEKALGIATAFLRALRNEHSLHASSVSRCGRAVVCVGPSGQGKSTIAERMCHRQGVELLGDDVTGVRVDSEILALPAETLLWIAAEDSAHKAAVRAKAIAHGPATLAAIVSLVFHEASREVASVRLEGILAFTELLPSLIRFETTSAVWERELDFLSTLVHRVPVFRVTRSHDASPDAVADHILGLLEESED